MIIKAYKELKAAGQRTARRLRHPAAERPAAAGPEGCVSRASAQRHDFQVGRGEVAALAQHGFGQ